MQYSFGSGNLFTVPSTQTVTPVRFGVLQNVNLDISYDVKELYGQKQFPYYVGRGKAKVTGKAAFAEISGNTLTQAMFGGSVTTGSMLTAAVDEAHSVPATPYQVTVTNSANFASDLGVFINGVQAIRVSSAPATGQYSVAAGVYTFAAADTGKSVLISYTYNVTTAGNNFTVTNQFMGYAPTFKAQFYETLNSKDFSITLNTCIGTKLTLPTKLDDFTIQEFDFQAFDDGTGNILTINTAE